MAELDRQKEKVSFWRMLFFFWLGSIFGLIAYMFNHFDRLTEQNTKLAILTLSTVLLVILLLVTAVKLKKETDRLGEL